MRMNVSGNVSSERTFGQRATNDHADRKLARLRIAPYRPDGGTLEALRAVADAESGVGGGRRWLR